jgi:hypothetical protein
LFVDRTPEAPPSSVIIQENTTTGRSRRSSFKPRGRLSALKRIQTPEEPTVEEPMEPLPPELVYT